MYLHNFSVRKHNAKTLCFQFCKIKTKYSIDYMRTTWRQQELVRETRTHFVPRFYGLTLHIPTNFWHLMHFKNILTLNSNYRHPNFLSQFLQKLQKKYSVANIDFRRGYEVLNSTDGIKTSIVTKSGVMRFEN